MAISESGPFLMSALFCDHFLHDQDGIDSYIRIIDRITFPMPADAENVPPETQFTLVIAFKAGEARGNHELTILTYLPNRQMLPERKGTIFFESEDRSETITVPVTLKARMEGIYWFEIRLNGELVTKLPFRINFRSPAS